MYMVFHDTWQAMALALPTIRFYVGHALVFMLLYVWSREFANARVSLMGLVTLQGFWLPWALLAVNTMFGHPFLVDLLGIVVGHFYYFLTVLHPQATGHSYLKTPRWVHQLVARWPRPQAPSTQTTVSAGARTAFSGRSYRLNQ
jgi:Derlin-2/3